MAKRAIGVSLESEKWDALQVEAEKRGISRNALFDIVVDGIFANQPLVSEIIDLDKEIKQEKLDHEREKKKKTIEQTIYLKNINEHFSEHGFYPSKPANFVKTVVEQPKQTIWEGSGYNSSQKSEPSKKDFSQFMPKKEITPDQWDRIYYNVITELSSGKFSCGVCGGSITDNKEEVKRHLHSVHGGDMLKLTKEFGFT